MVDRLVGPTDDMIQVLTAASDETPLTLRVGGDHNISGVLSAQTTASEIWLVAEPGATLSGVLKIHDGAPPIHIKGFEITARIVVEALAPLEISDCKFRGGASGRRLSENGEAAVPALLVRGGQLTITNGDFEGLELAIHVQNGSLAIADSVFYRNRDSIYVTGGSTRITNTIFNASRATALHVIGGDVVLKDQALLIGNQQLALKISNGALVSYELPAPLGCYAFIQDSSGIYRFEPGEHRGDFPFACSAGIVGDSNETSKQSNPACSRRCPAGYSCGAGTVVPIACENGKFCPVGSPATLQCPPGRVGTRPLLESADECEICPSGSRCPKGTAKVEPCGAGTHAPTPESEKCKHCEKGKYQDEEGKADCKICGRGKICSGGATRELECLQGTWSDLLGLSDHSQCSACPLGFYCPKGSVAPQPCPAGTVGQSPNLGNQLSCMPCADNTWSTEGSSSCDSCQRDYYLLPQEKRNASIECLPCLENAKCRANVTLETIELDERWWRLGPHSKDLHKCAKNDETGFTPCRGGKEAGVGGSSYCVEGHTGPICQLCLQPSAWFNPQSSTCEECPAAGDTIGLLVGMVGGVLGLLAALGLALHYASRRSSNAMMLRNGLVLCARRMHQLATAVSLVPKLKVSTRQLDRTASPSP